MPEYRLKTRIQNKYKTLAEWDAIAEGTFTPLFGEVCYAVENGMLLQKIGDGTTDFTKLEWLFCQAPQADQNENDINSPAYIKNRLGYIDLGDVPENEQEVGHYKDPNRSNFHIDTFNLVDVTGYGPEALGLGAEWSSITIAQNDPEDYIVDNVDKIAAMPNSQDIYTITIGDPDNSHTFEIDTKNFLEIPGDVPATTYCVGNPIGANLVLQLSDTGLAFPTDKNTNLPYAIILGIMDNTQISIIFLGDATKYSPSDPDKFIVSIKLIRQSTVYPIDGKFLINAQSDQFEMDTSKTSYIKNRYGDLFQYRAQDLNEDSDNIFTGTYSISARNKNNIKITNGVYTNNLPHGIYYDVVSYDVEINGVLYKNCPLTTTSTLSNKEGTFYFIGNPYLINSAMSLEVLATQAPSPDYVKICHLEDNGLPFLLRVKDLNSANFLDDYIYGTSKWLDSLTEDAISIKIGEAMTGVVTHRIPSYLLPADLNFTHWVFNRSNNSIAAKSAYSTGGVNAFAIGTGTNAHGISSVAIGNNTKARGDNSFAGGIGSVAGRKNSFAFGNGANADDPASTAFGTGVTTYVENQFTIGRYNKNSDAAFVIGNGTSDLRSNALTVDWNGNLKAAGSVETTSVILSSPNGTKFKVTVDDDGILTSTEITE